MNRDIVAIGASAGGLDALREVLPSFEKDMPASVFITLHRSPFSKDYLNEIVSRFCQMSVKSIYGNEKIKHGTIYLATPDRHLMIKRGYVQSGHGPTENRSRPAIDVMFRTAAQSYGRRVIGVLLTGYLDDGTAGLGTIKDEGGITVVQDPNEAYARDMPDNAIRYVGPDYVESLVNIETLVKKLNVMQLSDTTIKHHNKPEDVQPTTLTCPDCGGMISLAKSGPIHQFRCEIGHRYSPKSMYAAQADHIEASLWSLTRLLKEREEYLTSELGRKPAPVEKTILQKELKDVKRNVGTIEKMITGVRKQVVAAPSKTPKE